MMDEVQEFTRAQRVWAAIALVLMFLVVGGSAAFQSFNHIVEVGLLTHQTFAVAVVMPLAIDGMMGIATVAILQDRARGFAPRPWGRFGLWFGLLLSVGANVSSVVAVWGWEWLAIVWNGLPPILLLIAVEIVSNPSVRRRTLKAVAKVDQAIRHATAMKAAEPSTQTPPAPQDEPITNIPADQLASAAPQPSAVEGSRPGQSTGSRRRPVDDEPLPARLVEIAREIGRDHYQRTGQVITRDLLRQRVREQGWPKGFSHVTGGRLLELIRNDIDQTRNSGGNENQSAADTAQELAEANHR
jgi:hypothetical protein